MAPYLAMGVAATLRSMSHEKSKYAAITGSDLRWDVSHKECCNPPTEELGSIAAVFVQYIRLSAVLSTIKRLLRKIERERRKNIADQMVVWIKAPEKRLMLAKMIVGLPAVRVNSFLEGTRIKGWYAD